MDRDTIYLDNDEEITSLVDKLKGTDHNSVDLVIPKDALLMQSVVNLKILKKQAEALGKEIVIVTQDKVGTKLASQVGLAVIEKPGQEPKVVRMSESEPDKDAKPEVSEEEAVIEMKTPLEGQEAIVAPTAEVVTPNNIETSAEDGESAEVKIETSEDIPKNNPEPRPKSFKKWKIIGLVVGFIAIIGLVAGYIYIPLANITITQAAEKKKVDFSFTADKAVTSYDSATQALPGREITEEIEKSQKYPTTGKKKVGEKATGSVTIVNKAYSTSDFTIDSGSRIVTAAGLVYRTTATVTVPKFTTPPQKDGTVTVNVQADAVGETYNVTGGMMSIPGLNSSLVQIYATGGVFAGGTSREVQFVTQTDINTAKEDMKKQMEAEAKKKALEKTERTERFLESAIKITDISAEPSVAVNGEAAEFELKAKSKYQAIVFKDEDLKKLAEAVLGDQIGSGKQIAESDALTANAEFTEGDFDKGQIKARLSGEAYVVTKIEQDKLKIDLTGESESKALADIRAIEGVTEVGIKHFPTFYKRMPRLKNHIYIKTSISKEQ